MNNKHGVEEIFQECGAVLKGHFVLAHWRHSEAYLEKALIYTDPNIVSRLCQRIARDICLVHNIFSTPIEVIVSPALGGIALSQWTAYHLNNNFYHGSNFFYPASLKVAAVFTEKDEQGKQILKRGYQKLVAGKKVYIVDDILTTGSSVKEVIAEVRKNNGEVRGIGVVCNRGGISYIEGYPVVALWNTKIEDWLEEDCPLCKDGVPVNTEVGKGKEFLARTGNL